MTFFWWSETGGKYAKKEIRIYKILFFKNIFNKYYENNRLYKALKKYSIWKGNYGSSY